MSVSAGHPSVTTKARDPTGQQDTPPSVNVHFDFKLLGEREDSCFRQKEIKEYIRQWGMEDTLTLTQVHFCPAFMPHEETTFLHQLFAFAPDKTPKPRAQNTLANVKSIRWETLKCTVMSMDFFNCIVDKGIVSQSGNIRGCFPDVFNGVTVSDKLRELLVNPDSENADIFSADQQEELLFHLFRVFAVGGGVCQPHDKLEPYTTAAKALYKDLVSVQKNASTGKLEIAACKVYHVTEVSSGNDHNDNITKNNNLQGVSSLSGGSTYGEVVGLENGGGDGGGGGAYSISKGTNASSEASSPNSTCLVVVDLKKKRASVVRKEFLPFW